MYWAWGTGRWSRDTHIPERDVVKSEININSNMISKEQNKIEYQKTIMNIVHDIGKMISISSVPNGLRLVKVH